MKVNHTDRTGLPGAVSFVAGLRRAAIECLLYDVVIYLGASRDVAEYAVYVTREEATD
jgi:hypothetical protein